MDRVALGPLIGPPACVSTVHLLHSCTLAAGRRTCPNELVTPRLNGGRQLDLNWSVGNYPVGSLRRLRSCSPAPMSGWSFSEPGKKREKFISGSCDTSKNKNKKKAKKRDAPRD